jgi:hypothetical protein
MRQALLDGESLEVAGYELNPGLATAIDSLRIAELAMKKCPVHWFEIVTEAGRPMSPVGTRAVAVWKQAGNEPQVHIVPGTTFWATQEISECPELISATAGLFMNGQP